MRCNMSKNTTIDKKRNIVNIDGEKYWTSIFPNTKLLPQTITHKVNQIYERNKKTPSFHATFYQRFLPLLDVKFIPPINNLSNIT